jgi:hypothetical protein
MVHKKQKRAQAKQQKLDAKLEKATAEANALRSEMECVNKKLEMAVARKESEELVLEMHDDNTYHLSDSPRESTMNHEKNVKELRREGTIDCSS